MDIEKLIVIGAISVITIFVICKIAYVSIKRGKGWGEYSTKLVGVTFIVAMALIAYVYDAANTDSAFAVLGTLAGYFLGCRKEYEDKECKDKDKGKDSKDKDSNNAVQD